MHRRSPITMTALAPLWLLFLALFVGVAIEAKTFDVAVGVATERPAHSGSAAR